jgi:hypothetical protein
MLGSMGGWTPHNKRKMMRWDDGGDAKPSWASGKPFLKHWKLVMEPVNHLKNPGNS